MINNIRTQVINNLKIGIVCFELPIGSAHLNGGEAHMLEHLICNHIANKHGIGIEGKTFRDKTLYWSIVLENEVHLCKNILSSIKDLEVSIKDLNKEKMIIKNEIELREHNKKIVLLESLYKTIFYGTSLEKPIPGTYQDVDRIRLERLNSIIKNKYCSSVNIYTIGPWTFKEVLNELDISEPIKKYENEQSELFNQSKHNNNKYIKESYQFKYTYTWVLDTDSLKEDTILKKNFLEYVLNNRLSVVKLSNNSRIKIDKILDKLIINLHTDINIDQNYKEYFSVLFNSTMSENEYSSALLHINKVRKSLSCSLRSMAENYNLLFVEIPRYESIKKFMGDIIKFLKGSYNFKISWGKKNRKSTQTNINKGKHDVLITGLKSTIEKSIIKPKKHLVKSPFTNVYRVLVRFNCISLGHYMPIKYIKKILSPGISLTGIRFEGIDTLLEFSFNEAKIGKKFIEDLPIAIAVDEEITPQDQYYINNDNFLKSNMLKLINSYYIFDVYEICLKNLFILASPDSVEKDMIDLNEAVEKKLSHLKFEEYHRTNKSVNVNLKESLSGILIQLPPNSSLNLLLQEAAIANGSPFKTLSDFMRVNMYIYNISHSMFKLGEDYYIYWVSNFSLTSHKFKNTTMNWLYYIQMNATKVINWNRILFLSQNSSYQYSVNQVLRDSERINYFCVDFSRKPNGSDVSKHIEEIFSINFKSR
ncbi:hypothetical protein [Bacillus sp. NPDC077027]|uniref:hypothetical protein n=1 Tax=Bacillus sp. NPDC077027 TaxID=3390548 RepID=UPI003CFF8347